MIIPARPSYFVWFFSYIGILTLLNATLTIGCGISKGYSEETGYLMPIPEETLDNFRFDQRIENETEAVIAARVGIRNTRLDFKDDPKVLSVEKLIYKKAKERVYQPGEYAFDTTSGDTRVWLVIFKGEYRINPPYATHTVTPEIPHMGCAYAMIDAESGYAFSVGTIQCPL